MLLPQNDKGSLDPSSIPPIFHGEFLAVGYEAAFDTDKQIVSLIFYPSIMPFIRFSIPFHRLSFAKFVADMQSVITRTDGLDDKSSNQDS